MKNNQYVIKDLNVKACFPKNEMKNILIFKKDLPNSDNKILSINIHKFLKN